MININYEINSPILHLNLYMIFATIVMTPNDDAKNRFVHYVRSPIKRWSEFIK